MLWLDEVTPTQPWSTDAPVHAFNAGLSTSVLTTDFTPLVTPRQLRRSMAADELETVLYASPHSLTSPPAHTNGASVSVIPTVAATGSLPEQADHGPLENLDLPGSYGLVWFDTPRAFEHGWALRLPVLTNCGPSLGNGLPLSALWHAPLPSSARKHRLGSRYSQNVFRLGRVLGSEGEEMVKMRVLLEGLRDIPTFRQRSCEATSKL
ncbi:hypothetical protein RhiJN_18486 [Ceratobasidium sp. AG-Ba]|nr:hypothetical protein RhiJN_18486 [Ceratobasidium sp. AG-Ba]